MKEETEALVIEVLLELLKFLRDANEERARERHKKQIAEAMRKRGY